MSNTPEQFIISVMSRDRVGIVYDISSAISELEGDIADLRQSVLRGYFTMILLASFPATVTMDHIKQKLALVGSHSATALEVAVKQVKDVAVIEKTLITEDTYVLTASGRDRIGFVATVSQFCAKNNINIVDLSTAVAADSYTMILLVDLSRSEPVDLIQRKLQRFSQETNFSIVLQHYDIFRATNEIKML
jgi:glycine cleavage system transcriptional repressor